jgi:hypothetical protein
MSQRTDKGGTKRRGLLLRRDVVPGCKGIVRLQHAVEQVQKYAF